MDASKSFGKRYEDCSRTTSSGKELREEFVKRRKVNRALAMFRNLFDKLVHQYEVYEPGYSKAKTKALMEAARTMRREHRCENTQKCVGHILGIEVGDVFQYWAELNVIGLHRQFWNGIDYKGMGNSSLATSIVVTDRYDNARKSNGTLVYEGQGGNPSVGKNLPLRDQKLEGGNLALKNSMQARSPVRVILKVCREFDGAFRCTSSRNSHYSYVYDGLYLVETMKIERGRFGKLVFKFLLHRILGQPETCVALKDHGQNSRQLASFIFRKRHKPKDSALEKEVVRVNDLSNGREKFTIRVVTSSNCVQLPTPFDYVVNNIYSMKLKQAILCGCDCADGCVDKENCLCLRKNDRKMPNGCNIRLASAKESSLIYECGPSCKCSSSCINRVSQHGIQFQLEIFMTEQKGWGVRTRSFIPSGRFVCEYVGEVSDIKEATWRIDNDYIFHMGFGNVFINASKCGNVGRFINHSCCPNLHVKDIMYDHNDSNLPHKMLFALKDIPAGRELSYDYNSFNGKFIKCRSNSCHCGSKECNGQIYI